MTARRDQLELFPPEEPSNIERVLQLTRRYPDHPLSAELEDAIRRRDPQKVRRIRQQLGLPAQPKRQNVRTKGARVTVRAVRRKEVDADKLATALLRILEQQNQAAPLKAKRKRAA